MHSVHPSVVQHSGCRWLKRWSENFSPLRGLKQRMVTLTRVTRVTQVTRANSQTGMWTPVKTPPVSEGFQVFASGLRVDGLQYRRSAAQDFAQRREISIELEVEANNCERVDAIKVIGVSNSKRYFIGYVPRDASAKLAEKGLINEVRAELEYISQGSEGVIAVIFQLILPEFVAQDHKVHRSNEDRINFEPVCKIDGIPAALA